MPVSKDEICGSLKSIFDPEIPVNIVDLGLIYDIKIIDHTILIDMTLTNPACPIANDFPRFVENHLLSIYPLYKVKVELVFEPPWTPERMTEAAKLTLGL